MWPQPVFISLDGPVKRISVYDTGGAGKPVLFFVHGLTINAKVWRPAVTLLQDEFRCVAIDLPGHGNSWNERGNFSMSFYAQVIMSCIRAMKLDEVTLIGHSMGGQIAVIVSLQMPSVVRRLVLVAAAGIETFTPEEKAKVAQGASFFYGMKHEAQKILSYFHSQLNADQLSELAAEFITQQNERFQLFTETMVASVNGMLNEPVNSFLPQLQQPVLAIYGEQDVLIPNKWVHPNLKISDIIAEARTKIPNAKAILLPACGHYLQLEKTASLVNELKRFCTS